MNEIVVQFWKSITFACVATFINCPSISYGQDVDVYGLAKQTDSRGNVISIWFNGSGRDLANALESETVSHHFRNVTHVRLEQHEVPPEEIRSLQQLKSLRSLDLGVFPDPVHLTQVAVDELGKLARLEELAIHATVDSKIDWRTIGDLDSIRKLSMSGEFELRQSDLEQIGKLESLESLKMYHQPLSDDFGWLTHLRELRELSIRYVDLNPEILDAIVDLHYLSVVSLDGLVLDGAILRDLPAAFKRQLTDIEFGLTDEDDLLNLSKFENVENVVVNFSRQTICDLTFVRNLPKLRRIRIRGGHLLNQEEIRSIDHPSLESICITDVSGARVRFFREFD